MAVLQVHPKGSFNAEPLFQAQGGIRCHGPFAADELMNPIAARKGRVLFAVNKRMDLRQALPESSRLFN